MKNNFWLYGVVVLCLFVLVAALLVNESRKWKSSTALSKEAKKLEKLAVKKGASTAKTPAVTAVRKPLEKPVASSSKTGKSDSKKDKKAAGDLKEKNKNFDAEIENVRKNFKNCKTSEEKIDMLDSLSLITDKRVVDIVREALNDPDDEVRLAAASLLEDFGTEEVIPAVSKALEDKNEEVRLTAINSLESVDSPEATSLLVKGMEDNSEQVRDSVFFALSDKDPEIKEAIAAEAIKSPYNDVKQRVPDLVIDMPSHNVMDILIEALKDKDPEFKEEINSVISFFVSEEFDNYDDAKNWWDQNKDKFDEELFEK